MEINHNGVNVPVKFAYCLYVNKETPFEGNKRNRTTRIIEPFAGVLTETGKELYLLTKDMLRVSKKKISIRAAGNVADGRSLKVFNSFEEMKKQFLIDREVARGLMQEKIDEYQATSDSIYNSLSKLM